MTNAENDNDIKVVIHIIDKGMDFLLATGFQKAVCNLAITDRPAILSALIVTLWQKQKWTSLRRDSLYLDFWTLSNGMWEPFYVHNIIDGRYYNTIVHAL